MTDSTLIDALFDSPNEGIILADAGGIITRVNATAGDLLELAPESLVGQPETRLTQTYPELAPLFSGEEDTITIKGQGAIVVDRYPLIVRRMVLGDGQRMLRVAVALLLFWGRGAQVIVSPFAGVNIDRYDRRRLVR